MYIINIQSIKGGYNFMKYIRKTFNLPEEIVSAIQKYQKENMVTTFTGAMLELVRKGLQK